MTAKSVILVAAIVTTMLILRLRNTMNLSKNFFLLLSLVNFTTALFSIDLRQVAGQTDAATISIGDYGKVPIRKIIQEIEKRQKASYLMWHHDECSRRHCRESCCINPTVLLQPSELSILRQEKNKLILLRNGAVISENIFLACECKYANSLLYPDAQRAYLATIKRDLESETLDDESRNYLKSMITLDGNHNVQLVHSKVCDVFDPENRTCECIF